MIKFYYELLQNNTKNDNVPRKNSHTNYDTKIEDSHSYIAELLEVMPKIRFQAKITANFC